MTFRKSMAKGFRAIVRGSKAFLWSVHGWLVIMSCLHLMVNFAEIVGLEALTHIQRELLRPSLSIMTFMRIFVFLMQISLAATTFYKPKRWELQFWIVPWIVLGCICAFWGVFWACIAFGLPTARKDLITTGYYKDLAFNYKILTNRYLPTVLGMVLAFANRYMIKRYGWQIISSWWDQAKGEGNEVVDYNHHIEFVEFFCDRMLEYLNITLLMSTGMLLNTVLITNPIQDRNRDRFSTFINPLLLIRVGVFTIYFSYKRRSQFKETDKFGVQVKRCIGCDRRLM